MGFFFFINLMVAGTDLLLSNETVAAGNRGMQTKSKRFGVKWKSQKGRMELLCPLLFTNIFSPGRIKPVIHLRWTDSK